VQCCRFFGTGYTIEILYYIAVAKQISAVLKFYEPILEEKYDEHRNRLADLEQLQEIAVKFKDRSEMLTDLTLDPPNSTDELPHGKSKGKKPDDFLTQVPQLVVWSP
jgi:hypothetical protein